jgi:nicotinate phosphoribosyltransferase
MKSLALLTDLYQLTMANGYFKLGLHNKQACFQHFFRRIPFCGAYAIAAGLESALDYLENFHFAQDDLDYLASLQTPAGSPLLDKEFLKYLATLKLEVHVDAVLEGAAIFPQEPLLRVRGPILQCQLLETTLLNIMNFQTLVATKAARCVTAAKGREVIEFGLRRAQGPDGAMSATRAAFVGGCRSTSNVLAGKLFEIPVKGTQAHSWIMAHGDEKAAFRSFAAVMPDNVVLLVDTYHTINGVRNAIEVGLELKAKGHKLLGIRLDSGDLGALSKTARSMLDSAGLLETKIMSSGDLDEYKIEELVGAGAPIDLFGVGTRLSTAFDEPALGGVYKLAAIEGDDCVMRPCLKISDDATKTTLPGQLQTKRFSQNNKFTHDLIYDDQTTKIAEGEDLLVPVFSAGKRLMARKTLLEAQQNTAKTLSFLDESHLLLKDARVYNVEVEAHLRKKQIELIQEGSA